MKIVALVVKTGADKSAIDYALTALSLNGRYSVCTYQATEPNLTQSISDDSRDGELAAVVALGGDGTVLASARAACTLHVPVGGINIGGHVGFLADFTNFVDLADAIFHNSYEKRSVLSLSDVDLRRYVNHYCAINEVAFKATDGRLLQLTVNVEKQLAYELRADGLLISTPMGSTAYALAAGGPVIHPLSNVTEIVPLLPQSLSYRPLIVPSHMSVIVTLSAGANFSVYCDGVEVKSSKTLSSPHDFAVTRREVKFLSAPGASYFDALRTKLRWDVQPR